MFFMTSGQNEPLPQEGTPAPTCFLPAPPPELPTVRARGRFGHRQLTLLAVAPDRSRGEGERDQAASLPGGVPRLAQGSGDDGVTVRLRFRHDAARHILKSGHAGLSEPYLNPDGTIDTTAQARVDADGLPRELLPWLLSWGPRVQVLGPPEVRELWRRELRAAAEAAEVEPIRFPEGGAA